MTEDKKLSGDAFADVHEKLDGELSLCDPLHDVDLLDTVRLAEQSKGGADAGM
jgi:hypothetical protein